jgi:succinate dehydrogenase flavin-adding protein (antitoxin of CptAB toxin-antitoxin module)
VQHLNLYNEEIVEQLDFLAEDRDKKFLEFINKNQSMYNGIPTDILQKVMRQIHDELERRGVI